MERRGKGRGGVTSPPPIPKLIDGILPAAAFCMASRHARPPPSTSTVTPDVVSKVHISPTRGQQESPHTPRQHFPPQHQHQQQQRPRQPAVPSVTATTARAQAPHGIEVNTGPNRRDPSLWLLEDTQVRETQVWTKIWTSSPGSPMFNQFLWIALPTCLLRLETTFILCCSACWTLWTAVSASGALLFSGFRRPHHILSGLSMPPPSSTTGLVAPCRNRVGRSLSGSQLSHLPVGVQELLDQTPLLPQEKKVTDPTLVFPDLPDPSSCAAHFRGLPRFRLYPETATQLEMSQERTSTKHSSLVTTLRCFERATFADNPNWRGFAKRSHSHHHTTTTPPLSPRNLQGHLFSSRKPRLPKAFLLHKARPQGSCGNAHRWPPGRSSR